MSRIEQYLLAVYIATHREDPPITTRTVADMLEKSDGSVTEMFQRLESEGYVEYEPYKGVTLTEAGRERAETVHETYVTVSWFYRGVLDLDSHEAEAMEFAGMISPEVATRLASLLPADDVDAEE